MISNIKASIIICTYNRCDRLNDLLKELIQLDFPKNSYEIIIVDNASKDHTASIVKNFIKENPGINIIYVYEQNQGLSYARNRGLTDSNGDYVVYIDDDELPKFTTWLNELDKTFEYYKADAVGGTIELDFRAPKPYWLTKDFYGWLGAFPPEQLEPYQTFTRINGGNMAFLRTALLELNGFNQELGRKGGNLFAGEDTDIAQRLVQNNKKIYITPHAVMKHIIEAPRLKKAYFIKLQKGMIFSDRIIIYHKLPFKKRLFSLIKVLIEIMANTIFFIIGIITVRYWFLAYLFLYRSWLKLQAILISE